MTTRYRYEWMENVWLRRPFIVVAVLPVFVGVALVKLGMTVSEMWEDVRGTW